MKSFYYLFIFYAFSFLYFLLFIPLFKRFKLFDPVTFKDSEKLAELHTKKKNTPTMGGIIFILPLIFFIKSKLYAETILILCYFFTGLLDDILKLKKKNFSIRNRLWFEFFPVFFYLLYKLKSGELNPLLRLTPSLELPLSYYSYVIFTCFVFVGIVNSFNITDGVDGLLATLITQITILSFFVISKFNIDFPVINEVFYSLLGMVFAFLIFNFPPAKIFMGNVGSLSLGAIFAALYILYNLHIPALILCFAPGVNTLSVIIQSFSFRVFGKRVFPIAPLHHTFEFKNFSSLTIIFIYLVTNLIVGCILILVI